MNHRLIRELHHRLLPSTPLVSRRMSTPAKASLVRISAARTSGKSLRSSRFSAEFHACFRLVLTNSGEFSHHQPPLSWWQVVVVEIWHFKAARSGLMGLKTLVPFHTRYLEVVLHIYRLWIVSGFRRDQATTGHPIHGGRWWWVSSSYLDVVQTWCQQIETIYLAI